MRELVLFTLDDTRYGIWRDQVLSVQRVDSLHRLPFAGSSLTVLSVFGGRTQTLADLSLCLRHSETRDASRAHAWVLSERESIHGFLVAGEGVSVQAPEALVPSPDFLHSLPIEGFFSHDALLVPVIDVSALYERVRRGKQERPAPPLALNAPPVTRRPPTARFRIFTLSGSHFAAAGADLRRTAVSGRTVVRIPLLPPNIAGLAFSGGRILPIVDLAFRVGGKTSLGNSAILEATINGAPLGFLVDEDEGEWAAEDVLVKDLPPVLCAPWMSSAVLRGAHIAPLVELGAVVPDTTRSGRGGQAPRLHSPDSQFPAVFGHQAVEVVEFSALGTIFAVPRDEVVDVVPCQPFQELPMAPGLVAGLAHFSGALVPVLDLARIGGAVPQRTAEWRMIVLRNGDFHALLMCESARAARTLDRDVQRGVPVVLSFPVVYGCYTDNGTVRLVLNIEELTTHYHESDAALLLPAIEIAAEERKVRSPTPDVQERPALPEPVLPAELLLSSLQPSPEESHPAEPESAPAVAEPAVAEIEQNVAPESVPAAHVRGSLLSSESAQSFEPATVSERALSPESVPSIGGEDILEPLHPAAAFRPSTPVTPAGPAAPAPAVHTSVAPAPARPIPSPPPAAGGFEPVSTGQAQKTAAEAPTPARTGDSGSEVGRTRKRVLFAAAIVVLLGACVTAGLHFGIFRAGAAAPSAPAPAAATPGAAAPASAAVKQENTAGTDSGSGETEYVVREGDTLWDISAKLTGDAHNYRGLAAHNGIADPDLISPGQVIRLPR